MRTFTYFFRLCAVVLGLAGPLGAAFAQVLQQPARPAPAVTVVLAGGGAKGFAHLAVLRRLERDQVKIEKIIGTSMGAVIGGLYASGMSTQDIEKVISTLDPATVALDQVDRVELAHRARAYQQQYPVDIELGVKNGQITFARGVSDGQRFLTLLQTLTANVAPNSSFDDLKIPFRAVATRFRDGELVAFKQGMLSLAIRASMAAPGVFAPVEIEGETYVDGGLVANLPVEVALRDGADIIVASYLGDTDRPGDVQEAGNALSVANQMLTILMRQNERRNLALLRPQDILVRPQLQDFSFGSFTQAREIVQVGEAAVLAQDAAFAALERTATKRDATSVRPSFAQREIRLQRIRVTGNSVVPSRFIEAELEPLLRQEYVATEVARMIDTLYASGHFERINYQVLQLQGNQYELVVDVNEKTYGPNFLKASLGFYSESSATNLFSVGLGYRRPWLTPSGLELTVDVRGGSQAELSTSLFQPLGGGWGTGLHAALTSTELPLYRQDIATAQKIALSTLRRQELGVDLSYDLGKKATVKLGLLTNQTSISIDTAQWVQYPDASGALQSYALRDGRWEYSGLNFQFLADALDSPSFPTHGYYVQLDASQGLTGTSQYANYRASALWAAHWGAHVVNLGVDIGADHVFDCSNCTQRALLAPLYLGGFQSMGAYQLGQLNGDRLVHLQTTYMYRLSDGGIMRQPTYVGAVLEAGDVWLHQLQPHTKYSGTVFVAVDSKVGDIFLGLATGSSGNRNLFLQLGRRFSLW